MDFFDELRRHLERWLYVRFRFGFRFAIRLRLNFVGWFDVGFSVWSFGSAFAVDGGTALASRCGSAALASGTSLDFRGWRRLNLGCPVLNWCQV